MNKQIVNIDFDFTENYRDSQERELVASIRLSIDVRSKTFNITPSTIKKDFVFMNTSQSNWQLWIATAKAIQAATEFAVEYIKDYTFEITESQANEN